MKHTLLRTTAIALLAGAALAPARATAQSAPAERPRQGYTLADVRFVQGMIAHHAQALTMAALAPTRTSRDAMRMMAERIDVSQRDEIETMRQWLATRREAVPDTAAAHAGHDAHDAHAAHGAPAMPGMPAMPAMPGMLTAEQLAQLAAASGDAFDRLFLQLMIRHHEGAIAMVATLFATPGAGQDPDVFRLASEVDTDQRAEIARMRALLATLR